MKKASIKERIILSIIFTIYLILSLWNLQRFELFSDEKTTFLLANGLLYRETLVDKNEIPLSKFLLYDNVKNVIIASVQDNSNALLFNILLHFYLHLIPLHSDFYLRFFSVICG